MTPIRGANVTSLVGRMLAGAGLIVEMNLLRYSGMSRLFQRTYPPKLGSFLREFIFGYVRQFDAAAS